MGADVDGHRVANSTSHRFQVFGMMHVRYSFGSVPWVQSLLMSSTISFSAVYY